MNFFSHQERARKQSRWIMLGFIIATILIVIAIDFVVLMVFAIPNSFNSSNSAYGASFSASLFTSEFWQSNSGLLSGTSVIVASIIGLSSLGKTLALRGGGRKVATSLGGVLVTPNARDPLRRRLYNVVEEISLASGVPVPEVFVLENESAINAFAAGYSPADAAVAVTQGTLEKLNRSELQGVIAHEFSHILNGDMRINIRLMGVVFGIMVLAILGRHFSQFTHQKRFSREKEVNAFALIGIGMMVIGYIGLFFARWMKAAISRQREYLADASAVQFTRDPDGISGALKKIAAYQHKSYLRADSEEVSHMLFSKGKQSLMFATHPPLEKRIKRIEAHFDAQEIERLANNLEQQQRRKHIQAEQAEQEQARQGTRKRSGVLDAEAIIFNIGNLELERILVASSLASEIPVPLIEAAHSLEWAPEILMYCLLENRETLREKQLKLILEKMGDISLNKVEHLIAASKPISEEQRLPLLEMCFPSLKRRPIEEIGKILEAIESLILVDNEIDTFEYLLSRLVQQYLHEAHDPSKSRLHGSDNLSHHVEALSTVVSILASHGNQDSGAAGLQAAQKAYRVGMETAGIRHTNLKFTASWQKELDAALKSLNALSPTEKEKVINVVANTISSDSEVVTAEHELARVICSILHVPLPTLSKLSIT